MSVNYGNSGSNLQLGVLIVFNQNWLGRSNISIKVSSLFHMHGVAVPVRGCQIYPNNKNGATHHQARKGV